MGSLVRNSLLAIGWMAVCGAAALAQTVTVDASQPQGAVIPAHQNMDYGGARGPLDHQLLQNLPMKLQTSYSWALDSYSAPNLNSYDWTNVDGDLQDALAHGAHLVINMGGTGCSAGETGTFTPFFGPLDVNSSASDIATFQQQVLLPGFSHIKSLDPNWQYLEMFLEPADPSQLANMMAQYGYVAQAVAQYNATLPPGVPPILIGGSALNYDDKLQSVQDYVNYCGANSLPFDFCTWHFYAWGDYSQMQSWGQQIGAIMSSAGFNGPQFVTEYGSGFGTDTSNYVETFFAASWAQGCTYCQASGYYVLPFWFSWDSYSSGNESIQANGGPDGTVNPIYNAMQMWGMLKGTALSTTSDSLPTFGGLGSIDSTGVAVLLFDTAFWGGPVPTQTIQLQINNLPANFQSGPIQYQKYQLDQVTSNYSYDPSNCLLQQVANTTLSGTSSYSEAVSTNGAGVVLIVLTPATAGSPPPPPPTTVSVPPPTPLPPTPAPSPPSSGSFTPKAGSNYVLTNVHSSLALDVQFSGTAPGTTVWQFTPNGTAAQMWQIGAFGDGTYYLMNPNSGLCLGVQNDGTAAGSPLVISAADGSGAHAWTIGQWADGNYYLINPQSGLYLGVQNDSTAVGALAVISSSDGSGAQEWTIVDPPGPGSAASSGGGAPSSAAGTGGKGACGLTGLETVLVLGLLAIRRRRV